MSRSAEEVSTSTCSLCQNQAQIIAHGSSIGEGPGAFWNADQDFCESCAMQVIFTWLNQDNDDGVYFEMES